MLEYTIDRNSLGSSSLRRVFNQSDQSHFEEHPQAGSDDDSDRDLVRALWMSLENGDNNRNLQESSNKSQYARIIQKLGFPVKFKDFKIQNIVGSCEVKFPVRLEGLAYSHGAFSNYEPELFPGLIYRMKQPKIALLIFVSGKIVLTGAKIDKLDLVSEESSHSHMNGSSSRYKAWGALLGQELAEKGIIVACI